MQNEPTVTPTPVTDPTQVTTPTPTSTPTEPAIEPKPPVTLTDKPVVEPVPFTKESFKMPEGFQIDDPTVDKFLGIMNDQKVEPAARLQQLVDLQAEVMKQSSEKAAQAFSDMQQNWQTEVRNDPEIGGAKLDPLLGSINKMIDKFGSQELREMLAFTGAGNNIHMVRFLGKLASQHEEGKPVQPGTTTEVKEPLENRMYPTMKKG